MRAYYAAIPTRWFDCLAIAGSFFMLGFGVAGSGAKCWWWWW